MAYRGFRRFFAGVAIAGAVLVVSVDMASARSGGAAPGHGSFASAHAMMRPHGIGGFHRHGHFVGGIYWPGYADYGYGSGPYGAPVGEAVAPQPTDVHTTYTYDVPWDWAHRYPPNVTPSDRPYVSSCPTESVSVPGRGGEQTVNITRCY
ncbi:MAG: hypothetical protein WA702_07910 [Bradyrhizobium sp.]|jgi:hypothetical protein|uniref:hypothetical protein n=1 Tax=Bradyrhizobium sp. TaxID=376 RepID=UPI003C7E8650